MNLDMYWPYRIKASVLMSISTSLPLHLLLRHFTWNKPWPEPTGTNDTPSRGQIGNGTEHTEQYTLSTTTVVMAWPRRPLVGPILVLYRPTSVFSVEARVSDVAAQTVGVRLTAEGRWCPVG